jgi:hypothetical protein
VAGAAIFFLRKPLKAMAERVNLTEIDARGVKAQFEKGLDEVDELTPPRDEERKIAEKVDAEPVTEQCDRARLRNQIAHTRGNQIGWEDAVRFKNAANRLMVNGSNLLSEKYISRGGQGKKK